MLWHKVNTRKAYDRHNINVVRGELCVFEFLPSVGLCGHAIQRGLFAVFGERFLRQWGSGRRGSGVSDGVSGDKYCDTG